MKKTTFKKQEIGFTLIESLIVLSIFVLTTTMVTAFVIQSFRANRFGWEQSEAISHARKSIDLMVKEIREASPAENGSYPIETAGSQNLIFYSDIDQDQAVEKIRYFLDGITLKRGVIEPSGFPPAYTGQEKISTLATYVRNGSTPLFYYYNRDYPTDTVNNPLPTPVIINEIRLIRILVNINLNPKTAPDDYILISNSQIRNLKDNL